ncbi:MAG TPA: hypothetical protein VHR72_03430 [Gemmataceae bacterium]|nr:hypothetical protein [Gemmataceae bacterium]
MSTTPCLNCGTPVELSGSASVNAICPHCRTAMLRLSATRSSGSWKTTSLVLKTQFSILLFLLFGSAAAVGPFQMHFENSPAFCLFPVLLLVYFVCICMFASAPDRTARRSAVACLLTLVFGTIGLFGGISALLVWRGAGLPEELTAWMIGLGVFAVYFSAFVFLMRFHATAARAFGNRWLARECCLFLFVPIVAIAGNIWVERFRQFPPFFDPPEILALSRTLGNFAVAVWFAMIVLRTFRTIDRGFVLRLRDPNRSEMDEDDLSID